MAPTERVLLLALVFRNIFAYGERTQSNIVWILFSKLFSNIQDWQKLNLFIYK